MNRKGFAPLVFIIIVAGIFVLGAGVWYFSRQTQTPPAATNPVVTEPSSSIPTPPTTSPPQFASSSATTSNWKIYRNDQYGFTIQYRSDAELLTNAGAYGGNDNVVGFSYTIPLFTGGLSIAVDPNPSRFSGQDFFADLVKKAAQAPRPSNLPTLGDLVRGSSTIIIAGIPAYEVRLFNFDSETTRIYVPHGNTVFVLEYTSAGDDSKAFQDLVALIQKMIASLKFTR